MPHSKQKGKESSKAKAPAPPSSSSSDSDSDASMSDEESEQPKSKRKPVAAAAKHDTHAVAAAAAAAPATNGKKRKHDSSSSSSSSSDSGSDDEKPAVKPASASSASAAKRSKDDDGDKKQFKKKAKHGSDDDDSDEESVDSDEGELPDHMKEKDSDDEREGNEYEYEDDSGLSSDSGIDDPSDLGLPWPLEDPAQPVVPIHPAVAFVAAATAAGETVQRTKKGYVKMPPKDSPYKFDHSIGVPRSTFPPYTPEDRKRGKRAVDRTADYSKYLKAANKQIKKAIQNRDIPLLNFLTRQPPVDLKDFENDMWTARYVWKTACKLARRARRKLERYIAEEAGIHPTQFDLQLMNPTRQAAHLWQCYEADRLEHEEPLAADEDADKLTGEGIINIPNHEDKDSHTWKLLYKHLPAMWGDEGVYTEQIQGGVIQPALSTKRERFQKKRDQYERREAGDATVEDEEKFEQQQKQRHIDDPDIGAPYLVFVTYNNTRAVEIGRGFKKIPMNTRLARLYEKYMKADQQREELSYDVRVAIGTPNRLLRLSQLGYLKWNRCKYIVLDAGKTRKLQIAEMIQRRRIKNKLKKGVEVKNPHLVNQHIKLDKKMVNERKMYTLFTLKDMKQDLWKLYRQYLHEVVVHKKTAKLVLL